MEDTEALLPPPPPPLPHFTSTRALRDYELHYKNAQFYGCCSGAMWLLVLLILTLAAIAAFGNMIYESQSVSFAIGVSQLVALGCYCIDIYSRWEKDKSVRARDGAEWN